MTEDKKYQLDELTVTDILSYVGARVSSMEEHIRRAGKQNISLRNENVELKARIEQLENELSNRS